MDQAPQTEFAAPTLPLKNLASRHPGLTEAIAKGYLEAARVCFDRHHQSPIRLTIRNGTNHTIAFADWEATDDRTRSAWANEIDTTEAGACACVIAAVELTDCLYAVRRAETRTGADYYVAPAGRRVDDLEDCLRLEISGTDRGTDTVLERLLLRKIHQTIKGVSNLPALAGVVGFEPLSILIQHVRVNELG